MILRRSLVEKTQWNSEQQKVWAIGDSILAQLMCGGSAGPTGRGGGGRTVTQGFTLGYSRPLPPGGFGVAGLQAFSRSPFARPSGAGRSLGNNDPGFHPGLFSTAPSGSVRRAKRIAGIFTIPGVPAPMKNPLAQGPGLGR